MRLTGSTVAAVVNEHQNVFSCVEWKKERTVTSTGVAADRRDGDDLDDWDTAERRRSAVSLRGEAATCPLTTWITWITGE